MLATDTPGPKPSKIPLSPLQPVTGYWLASMVGTPRTRGWLLVASLVCAVAILCWLPVVVIQWRMRARFTPAADRDIPARCRPQFV